MSKVAQIDGSGPLKARFKPPQYKFKSRKLPVYISFIHFPFPRSSVRWRFRLQAPQALSQLRSR